MEKKTTSIIFTGDIGFDRYMTGRFEDEELLSKPLLDYFHTADHVVANVEGAVINADDDGSRGVFFHAMDPRATKVFKKMGADIWAIGNNHIMDAGREGVESTLNIAKEQGVLTVGAGLDEKQASEPVYINEAGGIGIICVAYQNECVAATATTPGVFRWNNMEYIKERIAEVKARCRWCVVVSHGGEEFAPLALKYTRDRYVKYLEMGADVIISHHPHVVENYELFDNGKAIFYSLGNFIFDTDYQRVHAYTDVGVLVKLIFTEEKMDFEAVGTKIVRGDERIELTELPDIFTNIPAEDYERLIPLASKAYLMEESRKMIFLEPQRFTNATKEVWEEYFYGEESDGYCKDEHMDLAAVIKVAELEPEGKWKECKLEKVKDYILSLM